jgi:clorobiocin biosynthesis protein CloN5
VTNILSADQISARLLAFIRDRFLAGDPQGELDLTTPLLELGILNSLNTATLIGYIRTEFGAAVPLEKADATTFRNVASIASMLCHAATDLVT